MALAFEHAQSRALMRSVVGGRGGSNEGIDRTEDGDEDTESREATPERTNIDTDTNSGPREREEQSPGLIRDSRLYLGVRRGRRFVVSSWLYRWLTAEPDPDVIVIDLRHTRTVGPILVQLAKAIQKLVPATVHSQLLRAGYRLRGRTLDRPVHVASLAVIAMVMAAFGFVVAGDGLTGAQAVVLLGVLLLAVRGTQSTRSWSDIAEMRWYQWVRAAFEPPVPPEPASENQTDGSPEQTVGDSADPADSS
jgi:hypothetical protein